MKEIQGKNINLRVAEVNDAAFILQLRRLEHKNKFLSKVDNDLKKQKDWLGKYKVREKQGLEYYFIIESKLGEMLGLVRIYDLKNDSFCWGSWLIKDNAPKTTAIESAIQVYEFGFAKLGFKQSHFYVRKDNKKVIAFHLRFGAEQVNEDELNYYFIFQESTYQDTRKKYKKFL